MVDVPLKPLSAAAFADDVPVVGPGPPLLQLLAEGEQIKVGKQTRTVPSLILVLLPGVCMQSTPLRIISRSLGPGFCTLMSEKRTRSADQRQQHQPKDE